MYVFSHIVSHREIVDDMVVGDDDHDDDYHIALLVFSLFCISSAESVAQLSPGHLKETLACCLKGIK